MTNKKPDVTDTNVGDTISRQAAIDALKGLPTWWADSGGYYGEAQPPMEALLDPEDAISALENLPSAQPQPKTGEWNFVGNQMFECTNCGVAYTEYQFEKMRVRYNDPKFPNFCPNCGSYNGGDSE